MMVRLGMIMRRGAELQSFKASGAAVLLASWFCEYLDEATERYDARTLSCPPGPKGNSIADEGCFLEECIAEYDVLISATIRGMADGEGAGVVVLIKK